MVHVHHDVAGVLLADAFKCKPEPDLAFATRVFEQLSFGALRAAEFTYPPASPSNSRPVYRKGFTTVPVDAVNFPYVSYV
jgi:hypothetical protein